MVTELGRSIFIIISLLDDGKTLLGALANTGIAIDTIFGVDESGFVGLSVHLIDPTWAYLIAHGAPSAGIFVDLNLSIGIQLIAAR